MYLFKATFQNRDTGKKKSFKVEERGMVPAIEKSMHVAIKNGLNLDWDLKKIEELSEV